MAFKIDFAFDVQGKLNDIVEKIGFEHIDVSKIICMRSNNSKANAYARIWSLDRTWQLALSLEPHYIIEVLSQHFDRLSDEEKEKTLIHEVLHIPQGFSGALVPHKCFGKKMMTDKRISELHAKYKGGEKANLESQMKLRFE